MKTVIPFAHQLLKENINEGDIVIDATCGNGNDTLFLAKIVSNLGFVYAFDVQKQAILSTKKLLDKHQFYSINYIQDSHAHMDKWIPAHLKGKISGVIFNLGYLPKSDKKIITKGISTIQAIELSLQYLKKDGVVILVIYHGHKGGKEEKELVLQYVQNLKQDQYHVLKYEYINQINNPPFVIAIQKR